MSHTTTTFDDDAFDDAVLEASNLIRSQLRRLVPHIDVYEVDRDRPLREEAELSADECVTLLRGVEDASGVTLPADMLPNDASLTDLARALAICTMTSRWTVAITFERDDQLATRAVAVLEAGLDRLERDRRGAQEPVGSRRRRRRPPDRDRPSTRRALPSAPRHRIDRHQ